MTNLKGGKRLLIGTILFLCHPGVWFVWWLICRANPVAGTEPTQTRSGFSVALVLVIVGLFIVLPIAVLS